MGSRFIARVEISKIESSYSKENKNKNPPTLSPSRKRIFLNI
jgi:hypothetical protein